MHLEYHADAIVIRSLWWICRTGDQLRWPSICETTRASQPWKAAIVKQRSTDNNDYPCNHADISAPMSNVGSGNSGCRAMASTRIWSNLSNLSDLTLITSKNVCPQNRRFDAFLKGCAPIRPTYVCFQPQEKQDLLALQ